MNSVGVSCQALALGFCVHLTPQPPTLEGQGGLNRSVKRCAIGKARRLIFRGIDPGSINPESGDPLLDIKRSATSPQSRNCQGAALIRRRLCGGEWEGLQVHSGNQFLPQSFDPVNILPPGLLPLPRHERSEQASSWALPCSRTRLGTPLLPLEGGGWEGMSGLSTCQHQPPLPDSSPKPPDAFKRGVAYRRLQP